MKMPKMPKMPFGDDFNRMMKQTAGGEGIDDRKNPSIRGAGTIGGGKFESLTISGSGTVEGNVEARNVEISGAGRIEGDLKAGILKASGSFSVEGSLQADTFVSGGSSSVMGSVKAGTIDWRGASDVGRDVEAKTFRASGAFAIEGSLEADEIDVELNGDSHVRAIHGKTVRVKAGNASAGGGRVVVTAQGSEEFNLVAKTIEGSAVELENTIADLVKGKTVKIGKGCKIGAVEYSQSIAVDIKASVKKQTKE